MKRLISISLLLCLLLALLPTAVFATEGEGTISYPVEGGNLYFDPATGTVTGCDKTVTCANIPAEIDGTAVTKVGSRAFYQCEALQAVTLPETVTEIGSLAFYHCTALETINLPAGLTVLGESAFGYCASLTGPLTIPDGIETIKDYTFDGCASLQSVTLNPTLLRIWDLAFQGCKSLKTITIPASVKVLCDKAFWGCTGLESVFFDGKVPQQWVGTQIFHYFKPREDGSGSDMLPMPNVTLYCYACYGAPADKENPERKDGWTFPVWNECRTVKRLPQGRFRDVREKDWFYPAVAYNVGEDLMQGTGEDVFSPNAPMTRAQLVTILWRWRGSPEELPGGGERTFSDVKEGQWYSKAVAWAAFYGIVNGVGDDRFNPNGKITREQLAVILHRYAQRGLDSGKRADLSGFADGNQVSDWAEDSMGWAVAEGLIQGSGGRLNPRGSATRAQVATVFMRFVETILK